jgi:predicted ATPase/transcriptional regulator with XRE-family HTH domain
MEEVAIVEEIYSFGIWLRRRRKALDMTQAELARCVGCAAITIRKIEADTLRPSLEIAERLASCLELPDTERVLFLQAARAESAVDRLPAPNQVVQAPQPDVAPSECRTNLPFQFTSFVGRAGARAEVAQLIRASRLVTLTGMGGSGKTRLALQVSSDVLETFPDGVWFVELAPLRDGYFVAQAITNVLSCREEAEYGALSTICTALWGKHALLILDNCEHVLAACAEVTDEILRRCPHLHILATSREPLNLLGEQQYPLPPLLTPTAHDTESLDQLREVESVRLFCERARAVQPKFVLTETNAQAIAAICCRLDGLPLAIELAAVHIRRFPPQTLVERLHEPLALLVGGPRNLPMRQQTLRTTIDWSYQLLDSDEQRLFARLGVFVGGWTAKAAEAVGNHADDLDLLVEDGLSALLDKSLIRQVEGWNGDYRFVMLETLQSYAVEQLVQSGAADAVRRQYACYYLDLVERAEATLAGMQDSALINQLAQEHENLRAVLSWAFADQDDGQIEFGVRLCAVLWRFWWIRGYVYEGCRWLDQARARLAHSTLPIQAKVFYGSGVLARVRGDLTQATEHFTESLRLWREQDDQSGIALALNSLGVLAFKQSDYNRARSFFEDSLALSQRLNDMHRLAMALNNLANIAYKQGELQRASELYQQGLQLMQGDQANQRTIALITANLGEIARLRKEYVEAARLLYQSATIYLELNDVENILFCLSNLVEIAIDLRQGMLAAHLLAAADALYAKSGAARSPDQAQDYDRQVAAVRQQVSVDMFELAWSQGRATALDQLFTHAIQSIVPEAS